MDIYFKTKKLQKLCSRAVLAVKEFGPKSARKLQQRLMELQAAESLEDVSKLPPARCHELKGNRKGQIAVSLEGPYRLVFIPASHPIPRKEDGGLDWRRITEIEIIVIEDYH